MLTKNKITIVILAAVMLVATPILISKYDTVPESIGSSTKNDRIERLVETDTITTRKIAKSK